MPPDAESPEEGSNTPILMTFSPEAEPLPEEEQAHRDRAMHSTKITAITLFIFFNLHSKAASIVGGHLFL